MNLYDFEHKLSDEIINRYKKERELYTIEINRLKQNKSNIEINYEERKLNLLIAKREQVKRVISALQKRTDPVYYYSEKTIYKIIGDNADYNRIHQSFNKARKNDWLLYSTIINLKANDQAYGKSFIGRHHHRKLIIKYRRLKKKNGKIQAKQRKIILDQVEQVGIINYGITHSVQSNNESNNSQKKSRMVDRLKSFKRAIIVGYNEYSSEIKSSNQAYTKK